MDGLSNLRYHVLMVHSHHGAKVEAWLNRVAGKDGYDSYFRFGNPIYRVCLTDREFACFKHYLKTLFIEEARFDDEVCERVVDDL